MVLRQGKRQRISGCSPLIVTLALLLVSVTVVMQIAPMLNSFRKVYSSSKEEHKAKDMDDDHHQGLKHNVSGALLNESKREKMNDASSGDNNSEFRSFTTAALPDVAARLSQNAIKSTSLIHENATTTILPDLAARLSQNATKNVSLIHMNVDSIDQKNSTVTAKVLRHIDYDDDEQEQYRLAVVVPGLGDESRIQTLNQSLNILMASNTTPVACYVYVYNQTLLEHHSHNLPQCTLIYNEGFWTHHMQRAPTHPTVQGKNATHVALLLDDVSLAANTSIDTYLRVMKEANYQAASPAVAGWYHNIMHPRPGCLAHLSNFIDVLFVAMTLDAWVCWKANVDRYKNLKYGWGLDLIFSDSCSIRSGIMDYVPAVHSACWKCDRSYNTAEARNGMFDLLKSHLGPGTSWGKAKEYKKQVHRLRQETYPYCDLLANSSTLFGA